MIYHEQPWSVQCKKYHKYDVWKKKLEKCESDKRWALEAQPAVRA